MKFWDVLLRRPCTNQIATKAENVKLSEAVEENRKALEQAQVQIDRTKETTAALEVAAEALAAVSRGRNEHK